MSNCSRIKMFRHFFLNFAIYLENYNRLTKTEIRKNKGKVKNTYQIVMFFGRWTIQALMFIPFYGIFFKTYPCFPVKIKVSWYFPLWIIWQSLLIYLLTVVKIHFDIHVRLLIEQYDIPYGMWDRVSLIELIQNY